MEPSLPEIHSDACSCVLITSSPATSFIKRSSLTLALEPADRICRVNASSQKLPSSKWIALVCATSCNLKVDACYCFPSSLFFEPHTSPISVSAIVYIKMKLISLTAVAVGVAAAFTPAKQPLQTAPRDAITVRQSQPAYAAHTIDMPVSKRR